jgi:hypothetical protein
MLEHELLISVAEQMMSGVQIEIGGRKSRVTRIGSRRLRTVRFLMDGKEYQAIEQNSEKPSRWGETGARRAPGGAVPRFGFAEVCSCGCR